MSPLFTYSHGSGRRVCSGHFSEMEGLLVEDLRLHSDFEVLANMWRRWQKSNANSEFVEIFYEFLNSRFFCSRSISHVPLPQMEHDCVT